jgi:hypothetical protein
MTTPLEEAVERLRALLNSIHPDAVISGSEYCVRASDLRTILNALSIDEERVALLDMLSEMLAASRTGGVHFAVEPEPSDVDATFAKRNEAHAMSAILTAIHPTDDDDCFIHKRPITEERCNEIIAFANAFSEKRRIQSIVGEGL